MEAMAQPKYKGKRYRLDKPELLAPAGNLEKLKFAVHYGADAVYIGGQKYGLRSNADNFSFEEMKEGVEFAAKYGAKVFVATNIYAHNEDIEGIEEYLRSLQDAGIAAIIAADPAIIEVAKRAAPKLEVHLSTQQSTLNWQAVKFWKDEGLPASFWAGRRALKRSRRSRSMSISKSRPLSMARCVPRSPAAACSRTISPIGIRIAEAAASPAAGNTICSKTEERMRQAGYPKKTSSCSRPLLRLPRSSRE